MASDGPKYAKLPFDIVASCQQGHYYQFTVELPRERYARGEITLEQLETMIEAGLAALPNRRKTSPSEIR